MPKGQKYSETEKEIGASVRRCINNHYMKNKRQYPNFTHVLTDVEASFKPGELPTHPEAIKRMKCTSLQCYEREMISWRRLIRYFGYFFQKNNSI